MKHVDYKVPRKTKAFGSELGTERPKPGLSSMSSATHFIRAAAFVTCLVAWSATMHTHDKTYQEMAHEHEER